MNQCAFYITHLLNIKIGLENRKKKREWLILTNCPRGINMFFYITHHLNLGIGLENRKKKREWLLSTNCPHEINVHFIELTS